MKDWLQVYKEVEERYLINAENDGQSGDIDGFEHLISINEKLKNVREIVEKDYNLYQSVSILQFANLLVTLGVYEEVIPYIMLMVREKEDKIKKLEEEREQLYTLATIKPSVLNSEGKFQEVMYGSQKVVLEK